LVPLGPPPPIPRLAQLHDHVDPFVMHVNLGEGHAESAGGQLRKFAATSRAMG